jgi:UDP-glucose 4-epimerase
MRVLVTGSSGQVGHAVANLLRHDCEVIGVDLAPGASTTDRVDILDHAALHPLVRGSDAIVHTASLHVPHLATHSRESFYRTNVDAVRVLLELAVDAGVQRFVYASTTSLYGRAMVRDDAAVWVTEALEPEPRDVYDETKLGAEACCRAAAASSGLRCVSLRLSRCFPEPSEQLAIYRLYRGVDVRDVAAAHKLALERADSGFDIFNISALHPFAPHDCEALFTDAAGVIRRRLPHVEAEFARRGWVLPARIDRVYATDKARTVLGYTPRFNIDAYLAETARLTGSYSQAPPRSPASSSH